LQDPIGVWLADAEDARQAIAVLEHDLLRRGDRFLVRRARVLIAEGLEKALLALLRALAPLLVSQEHDARTLLGVAAWAVALRRTATGQKSGKEKKEKSLHVFSYNPEPSATVFDNPPAVAARTVAVGSGLNDGG
jgi:hypothetical protein